MLAHERAASSAAEVPAEPKVFDEFAEYDEVVRWQQCTYEEPPSDEEQEEPPSDDEEED